MLTTEEQMGFLFKRQPQERPVIMLTGEKQRKFLFKRLPQMADSLLSDCESRHKSRHHVAIATPSNRQAVYPAKNPAILAGYTGHASVDGAIAPTVGMLGKSVVKEPLITAEGLQAQEEIEQQAKRKGDGK